MFRWPHAGHLGWLGAAWLVLLCDACGNNQELGKSRSDHGEDAGHRPPRETRDGDLPDRLSFDAGSPPLTLNQFPPRPAWQPSFPLGTPGWRSSDDDELFCSEIVGNLEPRVFSNPDAVYVLVTSSCNYDDRRACSFPLDQLTSTRRVYRNDGSGWSTIYRDEGGPSAITGFSDGRVVVVGGADCRVTVLTPGGDDDCLLSGSDFSPYAAAVSSGQRLFVLGHSVADPTSTSLREHDGTSWSTLRTWSLSGTEVLNRVVASPLTVLVTGTDHLVTTASVSDGTFTRLAGVPSGAAYSGWIYSTSEVFLGTEAGLLARYDGSNWTVHDTGFGDYLRGLWGAPDGTVFAISQFSFGKSVAGTFDEIVDQPFDDPPEQYFMDLWGNDSNEVFFAVNADRLSNYACGSTVVMWFDGESFHQF